MAYYNISTMLKIQHRNTRSFPFLPTHLFIVACDRYDWIFIHFLRKCGKYSFKYLKNFIQWNMIYNKVPVFVEASTEWRSRVSTEVRTRSNNNGYHGSLNPFYRIESQVYRKATRVKDKKKNRSGWWPFNKTRFDVT